jgi:hypothetical protein
MKFVPRAVLSREHRVVRRTGGRQHAPVLCLNESSKPIKLVREGE